MEKFISPLNHQHNEVIQHHKGDFAAIFRWNGLKQVYEIVARYRFSEILPNGTNPHTNGRLPFHTIILDKRLEDMLK